MSFAAPRSLLTATAAGALLAALWFIPTAHATADRMTPAADARSGRATAVVEGPPSTAAGPGTATLTATRAADRGTDTTGGRLVETGRAGTTPYLGGTLALVLGAVFVAYSVRRGRTEY